MKLGKNILQRGSSKKLNLKFFFGGGCLKTLVLQQENKFT
jgi:hypothetical protein